MYIKKKGILLSPDSATLWIVGFNNHISQSLFKNHSK